MLIHIGFFFNVFFKCLTAFVNNIKVIFLGKFLFCMLYDFWMESTQCRQLSHCPFSDDRILPFIDLKHFSIFIHFDRIISKHLVYIVNN